MTPKDCEHIAHLLFLAYTGEASPDQQEELSRWLKEDKHHDDLYQTIMDHERSARNKKYFYYSTSKELGQRFHKRLTEKAKYYIPIFYGMQPCSFALSVSAYISYIPTNRKKRSKLPSYS